MHIAAACRRDGMQGIRKARESPHPSTSATTTAVRRQPPHSTISRTSTEWARSNTQLQDYHRDEQHQQRDMTNTRHLGLMETENARDESLKSPSKPSPHSVVSPWSSPSYRADSPAPLYRHRNANDSKQKTIPPRDTESYEQVMSTEKVTSTTGAGPITSGLLTQPTTEATSQARPNTPPTNPWRAARPASPLTAGLST